MHIHIIMHESFESPAYITQRAKTNNHIISYTRLYQGASFPTTLNFDILIVMGGPQSPTTTKEECSHFDGPAEMAYIKQAINQDKKVLGICLGAQLIGNALGEVCIHSPHREIGVFDITLTDAAQSDPFFCTLLQRFPVGHRHGDMPGLTETSQILAYSAGCPRQIIKYSDKVYGFQCHLEFTPEAIEDMIEHSSDELEKYNDLPYIQTTDQLRNNNYSGMNTILGNFLDYLIAL